MLPTWKVQYNLISIAFAQMHQSHHKIHMPCVFLFYVMISIWLMSYWHLSTQQKDYFPFSVLFLILDFWHCMSLTLNSGSKHTAIVKFNIVVVVTGLTTSLIKPYQVIKVRPQVIEVVLLAFCSYGSLVYHGSCYQFKVICWNWKEVYNYDPRLHWTSECGNH